MPRRKVNKELLENLVSAAEIARRVGVGSPAVANWSARGIGFPEPVIRLKYDWREVEAWLVATGRPIYRSSRPVGSPIADHRFKSPPWRPGG